jgi:gliding motility-associated-like protein
MIVLSGLSSLMTFSMKMILRPLSVLSLWLLAMTTHANTADFTADAVCFGAQSTFSSTSAASGGETIVLWEWDLDANGIFGDETGPVVNYTFPNPGTFQIGLRITTDQGSVVVRYKLVNVNPAPLADITAPNVCKSELMQLTSTSTISSGTIISHQWDLDNDGQFDDAEGVSISHLFADVGPHIVGLRVVSDQGCVSTTTETVVVDPQPTVSLSAQNVCLGDETVLTATANVDGGQITSYAWELNGNGLFDDADEVTVTQQFISDGNYQIGLRVTSDQGCVADTFQLVTIAPYPYINFSYNTVCQAEPVQFNNFTGNVVGTINYQWAFGAFGSSQQAAPSFTFQNSGTFPVTLTGTTSFGCVASLTQEVTVRPAPTANFTFTEVCIGEQSSFGNTSTPNGGTIQSFLWNFDDANVSVATNPFHSYIAPGGYNVSLIAYSTDGCRDTISQLVNVWDLPKPVISANGPLEFCDGGSVVLDVNPEGVTTLWSTGELTKTITVSTSGIYTATIIDGNGCRGHEDIAVTVNPLPVLTITADTTISLGESVQLLATGTGSFVWTPDTFLDNPFSDSPVSSPTSDITYTATGTDGNGCESSLEVQVFVLMDYNLKPVNLFTPNGDGKNERFYVGNIEEYSDCKVQVFNRYGNEVFSAKPYLNDWEGTYKNSPLPEGAYFYIIECDGIKERFDGSVTILRDQR